MFIMGNEMQNPLDSFDDKLYSQQGGMKQVGKSMFINVNEECEPNMMPNMPNNMKMTSELKSKINDCLELA